jgi:hypothetical protein
MSSVVNALLSEDISDKSVGCHKREYAALCDRVTYVHLGRKAAMILAPSTPRLFEARLRLVIALLSEGISG